MSQLRAKSVELRAIVAVAAVCSLVFSLLISGTAHSPRGEGSLRITGASDIGPVMCHEHDRALAEHVPESPIRGGNSGHFGHEDCPCCLVSHAGSAVLPQRSFTLARPGRAAASVRYMALAVHAPRFAVSNAVNGARAPPALSSIS